MRIRCVLDAVASTLDTSRKSHKFRSHCPIICRRILTFRSVDRSHPRSRAAGMILLAGYVVGTDAVRRASSAVEDLRGTVDYTTTSLSDLQLLYTAIVASSLLAGDGRAGHRRSRSAASTAGRHAPFVSSQQQQQQQLMRESSPAASVRRLRAADWDTLLPHELRRPPARA